MRGVTFLAWINIYQNLKQIIQDAIAPEMQALKGEIKGLSQRLDSVDQRLGDLKTDMHLLEGRSEKRFDKLERRLEEAIDIRERLAILEARLQPQKPS
jgi:hypothetical protein